MISHSAAQVSEPWTTHRHTTVLWPFFRDYPGEPVPEEIFWTLWCREDNRGRHTDNPAGRHSIWTNQWSTSIIPHFYCRCPSCRNPPNLSWLGKGTKYAGLHTQWLNPKPIDAKFDKGDITQQNDSTVGGFVANRERIILQFCLILIRFCDILLPRPNLFMVALCNIYFHAVVCSSFFFFLA